MNFQSSRSTFGTTETNGHFCFMRVSFFALKYTVFVVLRKLRVDRT